MQRNWGGGVPGPPILMNDFRMNLNRNITIDALLLTSAGFQRN
jgi:hypothetical protein